MPGEQLAQADHADVVGAQRQRAAVGVVGRLGVDHDARALDDRRVERVEELPRAGHRHRHVGDGVAQGEEDGVHALAAAELGDLALDPDRAEPVDPAGDGVGDLADRGGVLRGGVERHRALLRASYAAPVQGAPRPAPYGPPPTMASMSTSDLGMPPVLDPDEAEPSVLLAAPRGYCAGVDRAVITVEKALDLYGAPVYVRKQIVHNKHVVANLESRGAVFVEEVAEVPEGATVVFSAHGVSPEVHRAGRGALAEDHRRHLPAGHQGAPRGPPVRQRGLRHPADRPRGPRGGRGHRRGGARAHPAGADPRGRRLDRGARPRQGRRGCRRPRSRSTRR